ncbi:methyltransferase domain-containing protein [Achromobacter sp. ES-001]|uniref:methyltransferase domain-containing protein n=1 Tax=Achromobacter sp. ES-001 TaxID=2860286 RepID=UPI001C644260|nr:methyltransferase domain-containing protein [Achromobacter sp. ES-001]QYJ24178.1 methyltransferase domain-containing protein [Achromobacter sp. ES-001]
MLNERDELIDLLPDDSSQATDLSYVKELLAEAGALTVMDLGCGAGRTYELFKEINAKIDWVGVDIGDSVESRQRAVDVPFKEWDGSSIPFDDASFDLVYSHQMLEYVRSPAKVISEIERVLKPGGFLVGSTSQFEPCVTGSLWNFKPLGFKILATDAGLQVVQLRPGIDGVTLIARAFLGKPKYMSKYFGAESILNSFIETRYALDNLSARSLTFEKMKYCGQFSFKVRKPDIKPASLPVITYHHHLPKEIKERSAFKDGTVTNTVESFEEQMAWLHKNGYSSVRLADFEKYVNGDFVALPEKSVLITFDDAHLSVSKYCYSILKRYRFTAVVFVITGKQPDHPEENLDPNRLQYVSKEELTSLSDTFEWAAHTHRLHFRDAELTSYLVSKDEDEVIADATLCRDLLQGTEHFCFPYGQYNQNVVDALIKVGFKYFYTTDKGRAFPNSGNDVHLIRRLNVSPRMDVEQFSKLMNTDHIIVGARKL